MNSSIFFSVLIIQFLLLFWVSKCLKLYFKIISSFSIWKHSEIKSSYLFCSKPIWHFCIFFKIVFVWLFVTKSIARHFNLWTIKHNPKSLKEIEESWDSVRVIAVFFLSKMPITSLFVQLVSSWHAVKDHEMLSEFLLPMKHDWQCAQARSHSALWNAMDCIPPGSSGHSTLQARILEWVAISYSRVSSRPRDLGLLYWQADSLISHLLLRNKLAQNLAI